MSRDEYLKMTGKELISVAEKLGLAIGKHELKSGKAKLVERILEAEAKPVVSKEKKSHNKPLSRGKKSITYKGDTKTFDDWSKILNIPKPTLYDRINRLNWTPEQAIETPLHGRVKK